MPAHAMVLLFGVFRPESFSVGVWGLEASMVMCFFILVVIRPGDRVLGG